MIKLPDVTLVCIDCKYYVHAARAILMSSKDIEFREILFFSDIPFVKNPEKVRCIEIPSIKNKMDYSYFVINNLPDYIKTSHVLIIQYDGYVINPELWDNDWLNYDYIGAPWWYEERNVGNGSFSLRSLRSSKIVKEIAGKNCHPEDDYICRTLRPQLEKKGIKFAPEEVAEKFSIELNAKHPVFKNDTFGFHGLNLIR